jgi:DNA-binding response OmpR family regulator/DNA-binding CsgD family transcriptional regulator
VSKPRDIVLVVDDSPDTLGMLNETLETAGFTVLIAQAGQVALDLVDRITPDIVLMDALMPGLDGFETCRRMKQKPGLATVPIVFMTGLTETEHVIRGLEAGGIDYVTKPVSPDEVVARIGVHLTSARLTRSAHSALDTAGRFLVAVNRDGHVLWTTPQASLLIQKAGGVGIEVLPPSIQTWLRTCLERQPGPRGAIMSAKLDDYDETLQFSFIGQVSHDELLLRVVVSKPDDEEVLLRTRLSLTAREAEVLLWLSRGKSNRDIATILGLSPRTVNKHLEQMFEKLGVGNRASATALAVRALQVT